MPQYTWFQNADGTCDTIQSDSHESAEKLCDHLKTNNIQCEVNGTSVEIQEPTRFSDVIKASEPFIGTRLTNG